MTNKRRGRAMKDRNDRGYSLVEVLVASAVVALSLIAVVAVVRKGQDMVSLQNHRAMARGIVERTLEQPPFQPEYYGTIPSPFTTTIDNNVIIDTLTTPSLKGTLTVSVGLENATLIADAPYRAVTVTLTWTEPGGSNETVTIAKWLADVQRD
jgi:Tfp pilus assembly protein PilW